MSKKETLIEKIEKYGETYYPLLWKVDGPYLYISNKGFEGTKTDGLAYFPSFAAGGKNVKLEKELFLQAKNYMDNHTKWLFSEPHLRGIEICLNKNNFEGVRFNLEFETLILELKEKYESKNKLK